MLALSIAREKYILVIRSNRAARAVAPRERYFVAARLGSHEAGVSVKVAMLIAFRESFREIGAREVRDA